MCLLDFIPTGRATAIPARDLARLAGFKDVRSLQAEIHRLRRRGEIILSATDHPAGYFRPSCDFEVGQFVHSMNSRIDEIKIAVRAAEEYISSDR